jgi:3-hydroxyisobutyrate dehydrogenase
MIKAFLGMGLLGSNFVKAMLKKGDTVRVWNRTASKAKALEQFGAKAFDRVEGVVQGADMIHLTLRDDASVDEVLSATAKNLKPGAVIIDHTTTSVEGAKKRTAYWKSENVTYLHAPVFMGPQNALESTGVMLVSGDQQVIAKYEPMLAKMTGKVLNYGNEEGKAAGIKLSGNLFLLSLTAGLADALALAKVHGIAPSEVQQLFDNWNPGAMVPARLKRIVDAPYNDPSWELNMARKDAGLMLSAANDAGVKLTIVPAIAAKMDEFIAKGHGNSDWVVIAKESL